MKKTLLLFLLFWPVVLLAQQTEKKFSVSGYVSTLQSAMFDSIQKDWSTENIIHNRLNLTWFPVKNLSAAFEMRNRFVFGQGISQNPNAPENYSADNGLVDLSHNLVHGNSYLLNASVDRFWVAWEKNKWRITLGRQRINWSQTWVWNPNDIFNAYSFFDFDYAERPGSDALRIQYYNTEVSTSEFAVKLNSQHRLTAAGYYRFNKWNYDFQFLGGVLNETDVVLGAGWAGSVKSLAVRGEVSYFRPTRHFADTSGQILASVAFDYTFSSSLSIMAEFLYNENTITDVANFLSFYNAPSTVKNLSFTKYNFLLQGSYPITPLLTGTLSGIYYPSLNGYYIGPSLSYSAADNIELAFYVQSFGGNIINPTGQKEKISFNMGFLRIKFSF